MNQSTNLIGRRVYRIGEVGFTYDDKDNKISRYGATDHRTVKGVTQDGRLITIDRWGKYMVVALGEEWKLEEPSQ